MDPAADVVAAVMLIAGVVPPLLTIGAVPVTEATAAPAVIPSNLLLSDADIEPAARVVAAVMLIAGVVPPLLTIGAVPLTEATAAPDVTLVSLVRSAEVRNKLVVPWVMPSEVPDKLPVAKDRHSEVWVASS
jgi:hypothetical protein